MPKIQSTVVINRPLAEVYDFVVNPSNRSWWQQGVRESGFVSGTSVEEGATIRQVGEMNGQPFESVSKVARLEPNREVVYEAVTGVVNGVTELTQRFAAEGAGTRVSCQASGPEAAVKASQEAQQQSLDADLASLKQCLET